MAQMLNRITPAVFLFIPVLLAIVLAGCGGSGAAASPADAAASGKDSSTSQEKGAKSSESVAMELKGTIEVDGSSTVFPVTEAVAEEFRKVHPGVQVNVGVSGTGGGFKRFVVGETDISDASRPIKAKESDAAMENGIEYIELKVGTDGLSVMVSPSNDFVECLTVDELKRVWEPGSTVKTWQDIRPEWPADEMRLYGPDTDSGTFDYFTEEIVGEARASRADYTASADDNVLVQGIGGDRSALGYFGYAYYAENQDKLKLVAVDSGDGCVLPTDESIESGEYQPLARPMFIYVNVESLERPEVKSFVEFYMENGKQLVREVGYIAQDDEVYHQALADIQSGDFKGIAAKQLAAKEKAAMMKEAEKEPAAMELKGTIEVDGSSTVFPVTEAVAEEFRKVHPGVQVNVGVSGTGGGFKRFVVGETDISDASRPIKAKESDAAIENGIKFIELKVGTDGLSVMVNPSNDYVECLTVDELKRIWEPGSTVKTWQDVRSEWPADEMRLYGPDTDSGTFDYFTEEIVGEARASRSDYTASADDNVLVQGIGGDRSAMGYFGYAYYAENKDKLKLVAVNSGNGCVTPTGETIESGEYKPLARPLFIYVSMKSLERPEVKSFVEFYMENGQQLVREVGYIAQAPEVYQQGLAKIR